MNTHFRIVILISLLSACLPATRAGWIEDRPDGTVIHVSVWWMPDPGDTTTYNQAELAGIQAFRERFPDLFRERWQARFEADPDRYGHHNWDRVEIALHPFAGIEVEGVETDLLAIAGGMAPDVLYVNFRKSENYIQGRFLHPLDRPEDGFLQAMSEEEIAFRVHAKIWPVIRRRGPDGAEQVWALPWGGALGKALMYRKDVFDEHQLDHPTADWTWPELLHAARSLSDPGNGTYGFALARSKHESAHWLTFLWSAGGEAMVYDAPTDQWRCTFDGPGAAEALDFYLRLSAEKWVDPAGRIRRGYSTKDTGDLIGKWDRGQIAMKISYIDERLFATIDPEVTGMVPVPKGPGGQRGAELNSRMMGLYSGIEDPAVRAAAWEYLRFYDGEEATAIKTRVMVEGGLGRFVNPRYLRRFGYPEVERLAPPGWSEVFEQAIASSRPEPYGKNSNLAYDLMTQPIQEAEQLALDDALPEDREERLALFQTLLTEARERADEEMIGRIPPRERRKRDGAAALFLLALTVTFTLVFRNLNRVFAGPDRLPGRRRNLRRYAWVYLVMLPALGSILLWQYYPLLRGSVMAFQDYQLIGPSTWVGLDNFGDLLFDHFWWRSVWTALKYSFLVMALTFLPPILLAVLLQEVPRGTVLFRTLFYLPAVITGLVTVILWKTFYEPSERGALNALLMKIPALGYVVAGGLLLALALAFARRLRLHEARLAAGGFVLAGLLLLWGCLVMTAPTLFPSGESTLTALRHLPGRLLDTPPEAYRWLGDPDTALLACVIPMVWAGMGPGCLIYLAALKGISDDFYEAADLDGAGFLDKILFIVFPMLKPLIMINFIGVFINAWYGATANILVMTGGAAGTEVAGLHVWYKAFTFLKFGPATAMAWTLGFMLIGFTVYQLRLLSRVEFRATGADS